MGFVAVSSTSISLEARNRVTSGCERNLPQLNIRSIILESTSPPHVQVAVADDGQYAAPAKRAAGAYNDSCAALIAVTEVERRMGDA